MIVKVMLLISSYAKLISSVNNVCENDIYCYGRLLHLIQTSGIYNDSKTFVDMKMKSTPSNVKRAFIDLMTRTNNTPTEHDLKSFVDDNFAMDDLQPWTPPDFTPNPSFINKIQNGTISAFAMHLVHIWPQLGRKLNDDVMRNNDRYSYIPVPNGMIVPGGRFRECYYWDTYWVVNGLLLCEMYATVKGIIGNFVSMVRRWGYVPNGGRIYYLCKSQPPLLTPMVYNYYKYTLDKVYIQQVVDYLEYELMFWLTRRFVTVKTSEKTYVMCHYSVEATAPRPEAYKEDLEWAKKSSHGKDFYKYVQSATESGWDFSSRWTFDEHGNPSDDLATLETSRIIPVDLNCFLYLSFKCLAELYDIAGNKPKRVLWDQKSEEMKEAINTVLWHDQDKMWYDYDIKLNRHRRFFFASNMTPLWVKAYNQKENLKYGVFAVNYLRKHELYNSFASGVPVSMHKTYQQWDFPNVWPPFQAIIIQGLENTGHPEAKNYAKKLAMKWVWMNIQGFKETGMMHEKYHALKVGSGGIGGEYESQSGFGWTNGVCLELINTYFTERGKKTDLVPLSLSLMCIAGYCLGAL